MKKIFNYLFLLLLLLTSCRVELPESREKVKIIYQTEHAVAPSSIEVDYGTSLTINELPDIKSIGYTFDGWHIGESKVNPGFVVKDNLYLVGKWTPIVYDIMYILNDGTFINGYHAPLTYTVENCKQIFLPTQDQVKREHHVFAGWYEDPGFSTKKIEAFEENTVGKKVLYAKWDKLNKVAPVTCNPPVGDIEKGKVTLSCNTEGAVIYYTLDGYTLPDINTGTVYSNPIQIEQDTTILAIAIKNGMDNSDVLVAPYKIKTYKISFNANGHGTPPTEILGTKNKVVTLPNPKEVTGYDFGGWYTDSSCHESQKVSDTYTVTEDVILYAKWSPTEYTITYELNNGQWKDSSYVAPAIYTIENSKNIILPTKDNIIRTNYAFDGWFEDSDFSGTKVSSLGEKEIGNKKYWAKWRDLADVATVAFEPPAGAIDKGNVTLKCDTEGAKIYYTLDNSIPSSTHGTEYTSPIPVDKPATIKAIAIKSGMKNSSVATAEYTIKTYTVTFDNNGHGEEKEAKTGFLKNASVDLPTYNKDDAVGYTFDGWFTDKDCTEGNKISSPYTVKEDLTLYAKWTANTYCVNYDLNGGDWVIPNYKETLPKEFTVETSHTIVPPAAEYVKKSEYRFLGWYSSIDLEKTIITRLENNRADHICFCAKWELLPPVADIKVNPPEGYYDKDDETGYYEVTLSCDTPNTPIYYVFSQGAPSVRDGKVTSGTLYTKPIQITKDTTISATAIKDGYSSKSIYAIDYGIKEYRAKFHKNNPEGSDTIFIFRDGIRNEVITIPEMTETFDGYEFGGWYKDKECTDANKVDFTSFKITQHVDFYAKWIPQKIGYK